MARALADALVYHAFSSDYIPNFLEQTERRLPEPGPLHLTRTQNMLDIELPAPDLSVYPQPNKEIAPIKPKSEELTLILRRLSFTTIALHYKDLGR